MSTLAGDFWVCGQCRSINNAGAKQCYNCRTPKDRAAVDPATIDPTTKGQVRVIELPEFRSSRAIAGLASILILAIAGMQAYNTVIASTLINQEIDGTPATSDQLEFVGSMAILTLGIGALALIGWSLWLSRTVSAMPALGLGYPAADGFMAFVENFIPGFNLFRVPAIVRDVVHRLEPLPSRGDALIFAAWIGLLGGFFVPRIAVLLFGVTAASAPDTLRRYLTIEAIAMGFVVVGAIFLVALIWWVEARIVKRRTAQLADLNAAAGATVAPPVVTPSAGTPGVTPDVAPPAPQPAPQLEPDLVSTRSAFAVAGPSVAATSPVPPASDPPPASPPPFSLPRVDDGPATSPWASPTMTPEPAVDPGPPLEPTMAEPAPVVEATPVPLRTAMEPETVMATTEREQTAAVAEPVTPTPEPVFATPEPEPTAVAQPESISAPGTDPVAAPEPQPVVAAAQPEAFPDGPALADEPAPAADAPLPDAPDGAVTQGTGGRPPHLTIRVTSRGMITAEMDGETEHVILDDLEAYGSALAKVDGTAAILAPTEDSMAGLIARRAQRILEGAGVQVTVA